MVNLSSTAEEWVAQLRQAIDTDDPFMTQNWRREKGELDWIQKDERVNTLVVKDTRFLDLYHHALELLPGSKCLFIVRHPCGALNSWRKSKEFPKGADFKDHWRFGACRKSDGPGEYWGFEDWRRFTRLFLAAQAAAPHRVKVFRYEDVVASPHAMTKALFQFAGLEFTPEVEDFLTRSHARHNSNVFSVFRSPSVAESWHHEFPAEIAEQLLAELRGSDLEAFVA